MKDIYGNRVTKKEFFKRWKEGIVSITPYQQARIVYHNTFIMIFGIFCGLVISVIGYRNLWWLGIILLAALINTLVQQIGNYQKYKLLKTFEKEVENEPKRTDRPRRH